MAEKLAAGTLGTTGVKIHTNVYGLRIKPALCVYRYSVDIKAVARNNPEVKIQLTGPCRGE